MHNVNILSVINNENYQLIYRDYFYCSFIQIINKKNLIKRSDIDYRIRVDTF